MTPGPTSLPGQPAVDASLTPTETSLYSGTTTTPEAWKLDSSYEAWIDYDWAAMPSLDPSQSENHVKVSEPEDIDYEAIFESLQMGGDFPLIQGNSRQETVEASSASRTYVIPLHYEVTAHSEANDLVAASYCET